MSDNVSIIDGHGSKTIIAFTGRNTRDIHIAEWKNILKPYYKTLISFSDQSCRWYLDEYWPDLIKETVKDFKNIDLSVGISMGGWAAVYYQNIVLPKEIRAFGPQSFVNPNIWKTYGPMHNEWVDAFTYPVDVAIPDPNPAVNTKIAFGWNIEDEHHYQHYLSKKYNTYRVKTKSHSVVNRLKKTNTLLQFLFQDYE